MPSGVFPVPKFRSAPDRGDRMSLAVRLRTRFRRDRLDAELAQGGDPSASAELMFRATQLRSPGERARLANTLIKALGSARGPNLGAFTARRSDAMRPSGNPRMTSSHSRFGCGTTGPSMSRVPP